MKHPIQPLLPNDIQMQATPSKSVNGEFYITLKRWNDGGIRKISFFWKGQGTPTVADILVELITKVQAVSSSYSPAEWITHNFDKDYAASRLQELTTEFNSRKRMEKKLRGFLGVREFQKLIWGEDLRA